MANNYQLFTRGGSALYSSVQTTSALVLSSSEAQGYFAIAKDSNRRHFKYSFFDEIPNEIAWQTIKTITIDNLVGYHLQGLVQAYLMGGIDTLGGGSRKSAWAFDVTSGVLAVGLAWADSIQGGGPPQFQLAVSGNSILVQTRGDGTNKPHASIFVDIFMPAGSTYTQPNYTVS